ncbi:hypothetical protein KIN20_012414 [Parelaphostrongylus tenuis]|uniref:Uncharacterized protein n=1 Tax=Parelaphostrongylus tenuis TaxID=148309 RepID=A0AAD5QMT3_PARTN|nr:hypothetical protein KIN20_012414 [Parelaphostrongylus tenuis]
MLIDRFPNMKIVHKCDEAASIQNLVYYIGTVDVLEAGERHVCMNKGIREHSAEAIGMPKTAAQTVCVLANDMVEAMNHVGDFFRSLYNRTAVRAIPDENGQCLAVLNCTLPREYFSPDRTNTITIYYSAVVPSSGASGMISEKAVSLQALSQSYKLTREDVRHTRYFAPNSLHAARDLCKSDMLQQPVSSTLRSIMFLKEQDVNPRAQKLQCTFVGTDQLPALQRIVELVLRFFIISP